MEREEPSPILAAERAQEAGGLWTTQKYGDFAQGDKRLASAFVTGRVEMRQLRGLFKLTFSDLAVVRRRTEDDGSKKPLRAGVFLTRKKTKKRMADLEETGYSVPVGGDVDEDGYVCVGERSLGAFDLTLRDAPEDPLVYRGLCIAKRAGDAPLTEEPAVYGYVRFIDDRPEMPTTEHALGLLENQDLMEKMITKQKGKTSKYKPMQSYTRTARRAWEELELVEEQQIGFEEFKRALDLLDMTLLEPRAMRLFDAASVRRPEAVEVVHGATFMKTPGDCFDRIIRRDRLLVQVLRDLHCSLLLEPRTLSSHLPRRLTWTRADASASPNLKWR
jgi:hypothetical protein